MSTIEYAKNELERAGLFSDEGDFYGGMTGECVMELMEVFSKQGHSNHSAPLIANIFKRLAFELPLTPLTGEPDEWEKIDEDRYMNTRCSSVIKDLKTGKIYDMDGRVFSYNGGETWWTNRDSWVEIKEFPYIVPDSPEKIYLDEEKG